MSDPANDGALATISVGDIEGDYFVPAYQRGYRWGVQEVEQLLNDIRESHGATYYLQPVVVKQRDDGSWELIDGQQRLTTLYLIFQYLQRKHLPHAGPNYSMTYETREGSKAFLQQLGTDVDLEELEAGAASNIDFFHILQAYGCIASWFDGFAHRATHEASRFYSSLFEGVKVLRYEAPSELDSTELFTRLNVGRIPLTDAELVKALLLSRNRLGAPGHSDRADEIAAYWDGFERDLRSPEVWAFVTGEAGSRATHISLLLDTLAGGPQGHESPPFHTFETLREGIQDDPDAFWDRVVDLHSLVLGWYDDRDLFHKIGYLIAAGLTFPSLVELSMGKGRSAFEASLDGQIRQRLKLSADDLAEMSYGDSKTGNVLLLMNVETVRGMTDSFERYSFKAHAAGGWSLEHIHAQNAERLNTAEQWTAWLESHRAALTKLPGLDDGQRTDLLARIDAVLATDVTQQAFSVLERDVIAAFSPTGEHLEGDIHSIANLALLDHRDNSALSNAVFEVKRQEVIRRDKAGSYIPACTRNVFLKYYTDAGGQQLHFWSEIDRHAYLAAIREAVAPYLLPTETEIVA